LNRENYQAELEKYITVVKYSDMNRTWSIDVQWSSVYNWHINNTLVFLMIYAITGVVNGENTELGGSVSKEYRIKSQR
jgi:hypothetical protein